MNYHIIWTDDSFRQIRKEYIYFSGSKNDLVKKIGYEYLQELKSKPEMGGKNLLIMCTDRSAIIYNRLEGTVGTVVVETAFGESERALLEGLLGEDDEL